jgi:hypothetical protein
MPPKLATGLLLRELPDGFAEFDSWQIGKEGEVGEDDPFYCTLMKGALGFVGHGRTIAEAINSALWMSAEATREQKRE